MDGDRTVVVMLPATGRAPYLLAQIRSIASQTWTDIRLVILLNGYEGPPESDLREAAAHLDLIILSTPDPLGLPAAFFDLIRYASESKSGSYFAFCDQDDIWYSEKIEVAIHALSKCDEPTLWSSGVDTVNALGQHTVQSMQVKSDWPRGVVAVECMAPGCSMVFNKRLLGELAKFTDSHRVVMHDWLACAVAYLVGRVVIEPRRLMAYRIHIGQTLGIRDSIIQRSMRFAKSAVGSAPSMESQARELKQVYGSDFSAGSIDLLANASAYQLMLAWWRGSLARSTTKANALLPARLLAGRVIRLGSVRDGRGWLTARNAV
jgi:glycosyltransferase involved in cell wall biosynthesis